MSRARRTAPVTVSRVVEWPSLVACGQPSNPPPWISGVAFLEDGRSAVVVSCGPGRVWEGGTAVDSGDVSVTKRSADVGGNPV